MKKKIKDAVKLVRTFAKYPDRTALTDAFIEPLKLLTDAIESQSSFYEKISRGEVDGEINRKRKKC